MGRTGRLIVLGSAVGAMAVIVLLAVPIHELALEAWYLREIESSDATARLEAVVMLGELGSLRAIPRLLELVDKLSRPRQGLGTEDARVIKQALDAIVARNGLRAVRRIAAVLDGGTAQVRLIAMSSLGRAGPVVAPIVPEFLAAVRRKNGPEPAALAELLENQEQSVAYPAACRLGQMGVSAIPHIVDALDDPSASVRWLGLHALLGLGPEGWAAAPRATELLDDPDIAVREHARSALAGMKLDLKAARR